MPIFVIVLGVYRDLPKPWTPYNECTYFQKNPRIFCWNRSLQWIPTSIGLQMPMCSYHCQQSSSSNMLLESKDWRFQKFGNTFQRNPVILGIFFYCWKEGKRWRLVMLECSSSEVFTNMFRNFLPNLTQLSDPQSHLNPT